MIYNILKKNTNLDLIKEKNLNEKENKRITIPKPMRIAIWNNHFGENTGKTKCPCCDRKKITQLDFECGHIIAKAKGGFDTLDNLIPVCRICNSSMQTMNFWDFYKKLHLKMNNNNNNYSNSDSDITVITI
jgi:5-methylcytosine-specific restriction endonuclease McrA